MAVDIRKRDKPAPLSVHVMLAEQRVLASRQMARTRIAMLGQGLRRQVSSPAALLWAGGLGFAAGEFTRRRAPAPGTAAKPHGAPTKLVDRVMKLIAFVHTLSGAFPAAAFPTAEGYPEHPGPAD